MGAVGLRNPQPVEDPGTILCPWEGSAIPAPNRDPTAGALMEEAQGVYQTNCVYMHIHEELWKTLFKGILCGISSTHNILGNCPSA